MDIFADTNGRRRDGPWYPTFRYPHRLYSGIIAGAAIAVLSWLGITSSTGATRLIPAAFVAGIGFQVVITMSNPREFVIRNGQLDAGYLGGRRRSWRTADLACPSRVPSFFLGRIPIVDRAEDVQFWVWPDLDDLDKFVGELGKA